MSQNQQNMDIKNQVSSAVLDFYTNAQLVDNKKEAEKLINTLKKTYNL